MITLAIDQSSVQASAALLDGDSLLAQRDWQDDRSRGSRLFGCIDEMLRQARVKAESLERFVVGVGPGSYTGLRTSIMAARAMAMPGRKPVLGVSSGDAIAERANAEYGERFVTVAGDARRSQLWFRHYELREGRMTPLDAWMLASPVSFGSICRPGFCVATPDWPRLCLFLEAEMRRSGIRVIAHSVLPQASILGRMAGNSAFRGEAAEPVYLHAAVAKPAPAA